MTCTNLNRLFFNDLSEEDIHRWTPGIQPSPAIWNGQRTTYRGWREIPSMYILCEKNATIPSAL